MSRDGWLPPGVTDADIDRAAQGTDGAPCEWADTFVDDQGEISDVCVVCGTGILESCKFIAD